METVNQETQNAAENTVQTFTQQDVDRIVSERLAREKAKYEDYDTLKEKAQMYDAAEEASKTELQKAQDKAAILASGLSDSSRIKRKLAGVPYSIDTLLLAVIADRLSVLVWAKTRDGQKNRNYPESIFESLTEKKTARDYRVFDSIEAFNAARKKVMEG